jgi:tRNA threonylcarbamoyladenosine biosynthesis protein TsaB
MGSSFRPDALYLALDTSGPLGSVALGSGARVLARGFLDRQGRHAAEMIPRISECLSEAGAAMADLAGVVVGAGPGSFTGVRVAAATAKGIAHALRIPLWPFSSLEAAAVSERVISALPGLPSGAPPARTDRARYVLFDARGDRVYAACYELRAEGVEEVIPPHATRIRALLEEDVPPGTWFAGDGAVRHESMLRSAGHAVLPPPAGMPTADGLLHLLSLHPERGPAPDPGRWEPDYVKASSAERARVG